MMSHLQALAVKEMVANGVSQRDAAKRARCSRATVNSICTGKWFDGKWARAKQRGERLPNYERPPFSGPHKRCKTCGGLVQMPCLACKVGAAR